MPLAEEGVRETPGALPDGAAGNMGCLGQAIGAVAAEGGEHPAVVRHAGGALVPPGVVDAQRGVAGGLSGEGECVDFGGVEAADVGDLLGLGVIEADQVAGGEDWAHGERARGGCRLRGVPARDRARHPWWADGP